MSSDTGNPRQRTVAELLAAHGDGATTGRRARRRAAEDPAGAGQVTDGAAGPPGVAAVGGNGAPFSGAHADSPDVRGATWGNGSPAEGATAGYANGSGASAPQGNGADRSAGYLSGAAEGRSAGYPGGSGPDTASGNGAARRTGYVNGAVNGAAEVRNGGAPAAAGNGAEYATGAGPGSAGHANGAGPSAGQAGAGYASGTGPARPGSAGYANGAGSGSASATADANGSPHANGGGPGGPPGNGAPYGSAPAGVDPRPASPRPRRSTGVAADVAAYTQHPDSDAPFVNGGAIYADTETASSPGSWGGSDEQVDGRPASRIGEPWSPPSADESRARPTEQMPRLRSDRTTMLDPGKTGPIEIRPPQDDDGGPATAVGLAPAGAEGWHRERTSRRAARDGGPPVMAAVDPDGLDDDAVDHPAGLPAQAGRRGRPPAQASTGQAWAAVVAQWIAGAIGGAALWVGFRFLWRDLPVVALAAAVLVTVGLVLVVRALMRNDDRRTTLFAVLVGLLLTVSPAILVLLGR